MVKGGGKEGRVLSNEFNYVKSLHFLIRLQSSVIQLKSLLRQMIRKTHMEEVHIVTGIEPVPEGRYLHGHLSPPESVVRLLVDVDQSFIDGVLDPSLNGHVPLRDFDLDVSS